MYLNVASGETINILGASMAGYEVDTQDIASFPPPCIDADGDGFNESIIDGRCGVQAELDCDDSRDDVHPLQDGMVLTQSTEVCTNTYDLPASSGTAIIINDDNIELECNGSKISGIGTGDGIETTTGRNNITIKNCHIENYTTNIKAWGNNWSIGNITSNNTADLSIQFITGSDNYLENSTLYNINQQDIIFSNSADGTHVNNNWFISTSAVSAKYAVVLFDGEDGWTFDNNTFVLQSGFRLLGDNYNITNNNFINMTSDLFASVYVSESDSNRLTGNNCTNGDCYFRYEDATNVFIANNSVYNSTTNINVFEIYDTIGLQLLDNNITLANAGFYVTNTTATNISGKHSRCYLSYS